MKILWLIATLTLSSLTFSKMHELSERALSNVSANSLLPPYMNEGVDIENLVNNPNDLLELSKMALEIKNTAQAGIPQELMMAVNLQRFLEDITDPNQAINTFAAIIQEIFQKAGISFDLSIQDTQTRGHFKVVVMNADGPEAYSMDATDFVGRITLENIRFGNSAISAGNIYITEIDFAPGSVVRIIPRE